MQRVFLVLVLGGFVCFAISYLGMRYHLGKLASVRLDPVGENYVEHQNFSGEYDIAVIGDSRAYHWLFDDQIEPVKIAVPGATTRQVAILYERYADDVVADVTLIQVGVNDLKYIGITPSETENIVKDCINNLEMLVNQALEHSSTVVLSAVFPTAKPPWHRLLFWNSEADAAISDVNEWIFVKYGVGDERVVVLDADRILKGNDGYINEKYVLDFLHINSAGYEELNRHLRDKLAFGESRP